MALLQWLPMHSGRGQLAIFVIESGAGTAINDMGGVADNVFFVFVSHGG